MHLAIPSKVTSSVLCASCENNIKPIFYISHCLNGLEEQYSSLEKYILCLIIIARKLKPYFQADAINVPTNIPLRHVLQKPDISGRTSRLDWS